MTRFIYPMIPLSMTEHLVLGQAEASCPHLEMSPHSTSLSGKSCLRDEAFMVKPEGSDGRTNVSLLGTKARRVARVTECLLNGSGSMNKEVGA